ncbi:hypothetical protein [Streptomyces sp. NA02950]|uniref:hypothetical protein n=1 Tax=Streptomyces sp. NA02950 TaxID=2742137 RepID=UPI0020CAEBA8|nr:hypothetical protein [Streptomyces sp. NA02950]
MLAASGPFSERQVRTERAKGRSAPLAGPWRGLHAVPLCGKILMGMVAGLDRPRGRHLFGGTGPDAGEGAMRAGEAGAGRYRPKMAAALMVGVHQQLGEPAQGPAGAGDVARDGGGDAVSVLRRAMAVRTEGN